LELTAENVRRLDLCGSVQLFEGDLLASLRGESPYDVVVANLPYVESEQIEALQPEVLFDPILALDGGADGLDLVRRLIGQLPETLGEGGLVALELGCGQVGTVGELLEQQGFREIVAFTDHSGIERFVTGRRG
jgi:release factor glutamine methyltransferase